MKISYYFILLLILQCTIYELEEGECPVPAFTNIDGLEFKECYR